MVRSKIFLALALIFAAAAAVSTYFYLQSLEEAYRKTGRFVTAVVAGTDIPARTNITPAMVKYQDIPARYLHPDAATSAREVVGKITLTDIKAGEPILKSKLVAAKDARYGLAFSLGAGERAVTVAVTEVSSVGGMVRPGDRVDVVATLDIAPADPNQPKTTYTTTILSDIRVLATGQRLTPEEKKDKKDTGFQHVTLAVTPAQAQILVLAAERGSIRLVLRSPVDKGKVKLPPAKIEDLVAQAPKPVKFATVQQVLQPR